MIDCPGAIVPRRIQIWTRRSSLMMHCKPLYRMIAAGVVLILGGIRPVNALAQIRPEQTVRRLKPPRAGGDLVGIGADAGQSDEY